LQTTLTAEQKQQLFDDGFIIIKNAVSKDLTQRARELFRSHHLDEDDQLVNPPELTTHSSVLGLFNDSSLATILRNEMGPFPEVISSQVAVTPPHNITRGTSTPHVDGSWSGDIPEDAKDIELPRGRPRDAEKYFGENDERLGINDSLLWQDPDQKLSLGSYTSLVGVAVNDQLEPGNGQFAVLKGAHRLVEESFRMQREAGGVIGAEGPGWPRIILNESGQPTLNGLPNVAHELMAQLAEENEAIEGWPWPALTPVLLAEGDGVIALHSCPHTATPNLSSNPRMNVYFRIRRLREGSPHEGARRIGHGVSDHPDRGYYGQFLDYPEGYDTFKISIDKLCDHWSDWDGMQEFAR
jgi:hypothetical protein